MYTEVRAFKRTNSHSRTTSETFFNDANVKNSDFSKIAEILSSLCYP
eukprot:UN22211